MKIAQVTATFPPYWAGTGNVAWHTARALSARGHAVTVFTSTPRVRPESRADPGFRVQELATALKIGNAAWVRGLSRALVGFDIVHLHYPFIGGAEAVAKGARAGAYPLVVTYHNQLRSGGLLRRGAFRVYTRWLEPRILASAAVIIAVHADYRDVYLRRWPSVVAVPHGVNLELFRPRCRTAGRKALGLPPEDPLVVFVGALDRAHRFKNADGLIRALGACRTPARLVVVGDGDRLPALRSLAARLGMGDRVRFLGAKAPEALPDIYSAADLAVLPSTDTESFGLVLVESMACGTPVVASALPGVREVVGRPGEAGWLVPPGDLAALARCLDAVLGLPPAELRAAGRRGRRRVEREFSWAKVAESLEGIYESARDRSRARPSTPGG